MGYKVKFRQGSPRGKVLGEIGGANGFTTKKLALKQAQALADLGYIEDGILVTVEKVGGAKKKNPSSRSYKGHKIKGKTGKYTVEPYGYEFPTLKAAKGWLDKHVRDAYPKPKKATKRRKNPLRSGQKFVIVDTLVPGGKWVDNIIHDGAAKADRKAQKLRAKRSQSVWKKRPHDAGYQVIDALWYGPSADRLRVGGMIGNPKRGKVSLTLTERPALKPHKFKMGDKVEFKPGRAWMPDFQRQYRPDRGDSEPIFTYGEIVKLYPHRRDGWDRQGGYRVSFFDPIEGEAMLDVAEEDLRKSRKKNTRRSGNPKRNKPMITREGKLGGPGYTKRTAKARHALLNKCVQGYGYRSCLGSLQVLLLNSEMGKTARKVILADKNWLKKKYGGPGSFGPRKR